MSYHTPSISNGGSNKETKVEISLYASNLKNIAGFGKGISDPYAVVTLLAGGPHEKPKILGKTEVIKNTLKPSWTTTFETTYTFGRETRINVAIFDEVRKTGKPLSMGSALFEIGEILGARGNIKAKKLKQGGTVFARVMKAEHGGTGTLTAQIRGIKLKNVDGLFGKSDPFFVINCQANDAGGRVWQPVHRSEVVKNNLNPNWQSFSIPLSKLCKGNKDRPIQIQVFDWEKSGKHQTMGAIETTVNALQFLVGGADKKMNLLHKNKNYGQIQVDSLTITGENSSTAAGASPNTSAGPPKKFITVNGISKMNPEYKKWKDAQSSGAPTDKTPTTSLPAPIMPPESKSYTPPPATAPHAAPSATAPLPAFGQALNNPPPAFAPLPPAMPPPSAPSRQSLGSGSGASQFVDYISGGTEINMVVAVDYTGSNGDPRKPGTLHYIHREQLNDYEKALTAVGSIVARYDSDQMFPVLGFGAKYSGVIQHCFQVGKAAELRGIQGILEGYRGVFATGLTMSGPTVFAEVIRNAARQAHAQQNANDAVGKQSYTILLILTDGAVTDIEETKNAIREASSAPLSIVIVGIGSADFSAMQFLDDFHLHDGGRTRDIVQFVEFNQHKHDRQALTRETLEEIPDQLVGYFHGKGIKPLKPTGVSQINVFEEDYNSMQDLNLSFNFAPDGEIVLADPSKATFDAQSFGTVGQFLTPGGQSSAPSPYGSTPSPYGSTPSPYGSTPSPYGSTPSPYGSTPSPYGSTPSPYGSAPSPYGSTPSPYGSAPSPYGAPSGSAGAYGSYAPAGGGGYTAAAPTPYGAPAAALTQVKIRAPANSHPGMQLMVTNPKTGTKQTVTVPAGVAPGTLFTAQLS